MPLRGWTVGLGTISNSWEEAGKLWPQGFQFDLEPPLPAGETVCGDSHAGPIK